VRVSHFLIAALAKSCTMRIHCDKLKEIKEGKLSRERICPLVLPLLFDVSQNYIPQIEEFPDIKNIVNKYIKCIVKIFSRCSPNPAKP
jgi:hypothetical protein